MKTHQVSSSTTLGLKFALPALWIVFFSLFTLALFLTDKDGFGVIPSSTFKYYMLGFLVFGIAFLYWSVIRLKRVEMDGEFLYASNYFKTFRYPYHQIEKFTEKDYFFFSSFHVHLKQAGNFGKKMTFIASKKKFEKFAAQYPDVAQQFVDLVE